MMWLICCTTLLCAGSECEAIKDTGPEQMLEISFAARHVILRTRWRYAHVYVPDNKQRCATVL
jgi:hypothetical protein